MASEDRVTVGEVWDWLSDQAIQHEGSAAARRLCGENVAAERLAAKALMFRKAADFILFLINHEDGVKAFMRSKSAAKSRAIASKRTPT